MQRSIVGILALVALVQGIHSLPVTSHIDALSQKLEDHYHGKNLDNEITFAECQSTFKEFAGLDQNFDLVLPQQPEPLFKTLLFLDGFLYANLKNVPGKLMKLETSDEAAAEFITELENAYKRFRPVYNFEFNIEQAPLEAQQQFMGVLNHLAGKGELPTDEQFNGALTAAIELKEYIDQLFKDQDVYKNQDDFETLLKIWTTPELGSWTGKVWKLLKDDEKQDKYFEGDEAVTKELQQVYQDGIAAIIKNLRSD